MRWVTSFQVIPHWKIQAPNKVPIPVKKDGWFFAGLGFEPCSTSHLKGRCSTNWAFAVALLASFRAHPYTPLSAGCTFTHRLLTEFCLVGFKLCTKRRNWKMQLSNESLECVPSQKHTTFSHSFPPQVMLFHHQSLNAVREKDKGGCFASPTFQPKPCAIKLLAVGWNEGAPGWCHAPQIHWKGHQCSVSLKLSSHFSRHSRVSSS